MLSVLERMQMEALERARAAYSRCWPFCGFCVANRCVVPVGSAAPGGCSPTRPSAPRTVLDPSLPNHQHALQHETDLAQRRGVRFEQGYIVELPDDPPSGAIVGFDVIHDQADPSDVLQRVHRALVCSS